MPETQATRRLITHVVHRYHDPLRETLPDLQLAVAHAARAPGLHHAALREIELLAGDVIDLSLAHADEQERIVFPVLLGRRPAPQDFPSCLAHARAQALALVRLASKLQRAVERIAADDALPRLLAARLETLASDLYDQVGMELGELLSPTR